MAKNKTVVIHQDYYRFIFNPAGAGSKPNSNVIHRMIEHNTAVALQTGYDVILEGILSVKSYQSIIERLIKSHPGKSYIFYFDISFKETVRRHQAKNEKLSYGKKEMEKWYLAAKKSGHKLETLIPESFSKNKIIKKFLEISKFESTTK